MATQITTLLGNELKTTEAPRVMDRQFASFPGAHGITSITMGSRGWQLVFTGKVRLGGANYAAARAAAQTAIWNIAAMTAWDAGDYTYQNVTYYNCVWTNFRVLGGEKTYVYTSNGYITVEFTITLQGLL